MRYAALVLDDLGVLRAAPGLPPDPDVVALVLAVRAAGLRTAVLSNADDVDPAAGFERLADVVCVSGQTGLRKPDPAAFADVARRLGVPTSACVHVDDLPANVRAAAAAGMTGVLHVDLATTTAEVSALLEAPAV